MEKTSRGIPNCALCGTPITAELQQSKDKGSIICNAVMETKKTFAYGLSGLYEFEEDLGLKQGDELCINCMTAHKFHEAKTFPCALCGEKYQPWYDNANGAWDCCGHVQEREGKMEISCGYGSSFDCMAFVLKKETSLKKDHDFVCDKCIQSMIDKDEVEIDNSFWTELEKKNPSPEIIELINSPEWKKQIDDFNEKYGEDFKTSGDPTRVPLKISDPTKL